MSLFTRITKWYTEDDIKPVSLNTEFDNIVNTLNSLDAGNLPWTNIKVTTLLGNITFSPTTGGIVGTTTNDSASAGIVGEYISSAVQGVNTAAGSNAFGNITSIILTKGDWDVSGVVTQNNTVITPTGNYSIALSAFSGNTTTDHVLGDNNIYGEVAAVSSSQYSTLTVPAWRVSIASTTTIYLKGLQVFSAGTLSFNGRISARRVR